MSKIVDRLKEPSTHAGLASIVAGFGLIFRSPETSDIAATIPTVAERLVSNDYLGAAMLLFGSIAVVVREKK